jgi:hypothetical protein
VKSCSLGKNFYSSGRVDRIIDFEMPFADSALRYANRRTLPDSRGSCENAHEEKSYEKYVCRTSDLRKSLLLPPQSPPNNSYIALICF